MGRPVQPHSPCHCWKEAMVPRCPGRLRTPSRGPPPLRRSFSRYTAPAAAGLQGGCPPRHAPPGPEAPRPGRPQPPSGPGTGRAPPGRGLLWGGCKSARGISPERRVCPDPASHLRLKGAWAAAPGPGLVGDWPGHGTAALAALRHKAGLGHTAPGAGVPCQQTALGAVGAKGRVVGLAAGSAERRAECAPPGPRPSLHLQAEGGGVRAGGRWGPRLPL